MRLGELFLGYARRRAADLDQVRSQIEDLAGVRRGRVLLAASQALAPAFLPRAIHEFQATRPGIAFEVKVLDRERAVRAVTEFEVDLALVFNPPDLRGLAVLAQARQRTCAIVAPDHPLAGRASVRLKDCLAYPLALPDGSLSGRSVLDDLFEKSSARPRPPLVSNSYEMMRGFAREAGGGTHPAAFTRQRDFALTRCARSAPAILAARLTRKRVRRRLGESENAVEQGVKKLFAGDHGHFAGGDRVRLPGPVHGLCVAVARRRRHAEDGAEPHNDTLP